MPTPQFTNILNKEDSKVHDSVKIKTEEELTIYEVAKAIEDRFWTMVDKTESCWLWNPTKKNHSGYGFMAHKGKTYHAHRISLAIHGRRLEGGEVDHLCRNQGCVNPDHLEVVSHQLNIQRSKRKQAHCKRGHELSAGSTYVKYSSYGTKERQCKQCSAIRGYEESENKKIQRIVKKEALALLGRLDVITSKYGTEHYEQMGIDEVRGFIRKEREQL